MTAPSLTPDEILALLVTIRDWAEKEAFYYRRRAADAHDRTHAIQLEDVNAWLEAIVANLRAARRADPVP